MKNKTGGITLHVTAKGLSVLSKETKAMLIEVINRIFKEQNDAKTP